ncbi:MAG: Bax inhibitor-1/YccA family protein [Candidatus Omnitrophota bacterium]|nr:Bax inhibitor-1/YccA family protein [Candidatus Omnitrophota bacterium]MBU2529082.1 Bax inhibitor-1/YccA family protein [bacterium]MBU3930370.1 Bax inhibitor-1/YccA family protein [bacterium]MBU4122748.1 Bax inhibitor-1/YccA family protein [bacterium]
MRTANPALNSKTFEVTADYSSAEKMTLQGTVNKSGILLLLLALAASWVWRGYFNPGTATGSVMPLMFIGAIGGFVVGMITVFAKKASPFTAPLYAVLEGLFLGGFSAIMEGRYQGIVIQAAALTFAAAGCLLLAYTSGLIKVSDNFRLGVVAATGAIALIYFLTFILGLFRVNVPYIHSSGLVGIAFSLFVVVVASMNLVMDFDFIETGAEQGAPKYMEWYAAFGLMVTLVWLYIEILRLLAKMRDRR